MEMNYPSPPLRNAHLVWICCKDRQDILDMLQFYPQMSIYSYPHTSIYLGQIERFILRNWLMQLGVWQIQNLVGTRSSWTPREEVML